ncbi:MAG: pyridoxamine 5'-phosphate oxidase [Ferruginibacter sp.]|nr:pyridoxamine 5'-phosphate oxidase [Ferruginibacter sp.]
MKNIADIRKEYKLESLDESGSDNDPIKQFGIWWEQAAGSNIEEVNAMTLSTVGENNRPSSRTVLLKDYQEEGFTFFTNYESHKGNDINKNPYVSLVFFWKELERQVRIEGIARKVSSAQSDEYFNSRPAGSRIGAWASPQSKMIASRAVLEKNEVEYTQKFAGGNIPRPPHWGGYLVEPDLIEFWQGRPGRLHDRIRYRKNEIANPKENTNGNWIKDRLAP